MRRRLPDERDDRPFRIFMIGTFWLAVLGAVLLFVAPWEWGAALIGLSVLLFLGAVLFGA